MKEASEEQNIDVHVTRIGGYLKQRLLDFQAKHVNFVSEVRGLGLMIGVECKTDCGDFVNRLLSIGVLVNCTNGNVIRLLPPLVIEEEHVDVFMATFEKSRPAQAFHPVSDCRWASCH